MAVIMYGSTILDISVTWETAHLAL